MMKRVLVTVLCLIAAATVTTFAADASGTWDVNGDVAGNPLIMTCVLKQDNDKLSGTAKVQGADTPLTGSIKDNAVSFEFDFAGGYHLVFNGTVADKDMKGSISVAGIEGTFTAKKQ
jgi:hypothetical protein